MATASITVDSLVASILRSYAAANELILQSQEPDLSPRESGTALHQEAQFIVGNASNKPPVAVPLALFSLPVRYYLCALHFDLPCYTISGTRFFKRLQLTGTMVLHSFTPTRWQRLFYICNLYHIVVEIDGGQTKVSFRATTAEEEAIRLINGKRLPNRTAWKFRLTPEQELQLRLLPKTTAKLMYWRSDLMRIWRWLSALR